MSKPTGTHCGGVQYDHGRAKGRLVRAYWYTDTATGSTPERSADLAAKRARSRQRRRATDGLKTRTEDFETTLRTIPENERSASSDNLSCYVPTTYEKVDRSPYRSPHFLRRKRRRSSNEVSKESSRKDLSESSDDEEAAPKPPSTPTPAGRTTEEVRRSQRLARRPGPRGSGAQEQPYCSQRCLSTLVQGGFLDSDCPNVALHRKGNAGDRERHPVDHAEWIRLLWKQLEQSLDDGITPLGDVGARSVLFKVTMLTYGYTFVSKGTVQAFVKDLENEAAVYHRLRPVQGVYVPVFLGAIDLRSTSKICYYDHRVYIVHMTFLSWGGFSVLQSVNAGDPQKSLQDEAIRALQAIHQEGVIHRDVRLANMLINSETNGVMLIDFERASLLRPPRRPLAPLVPNKRKRGQGRTDLGKATQKPEGARDRGRRTFAEDILTMRSVFSGSIRQRAKV